MQGERWAPMKGFEHRFECSTFGRLRSVAKSWKVGTSTRHKAPVLIKPGKSGAYYVYDRMEHYKIEPAEIKRLAFEVLGEKDE